MKTLINYIIMLLPALVSGCKNYAQPTGVSAHLVPWLAANGKFGYADSTGKMVISPQFDDVGAFQNDFALVGKNGRYGVINAAGKIVVALKYPFVQLNARGPFTIAILKKECNAWWRFWRWKVLPDWSIFGRNSGPFLVTKVPMAEWVALSLPQHKVLFEQKRRDGKDSWGTSRYWKKDWQPDRSLPRDITVASADSLIAVSHHVFSLAKTGRLKKISSRFQYFTATDELMVQKGANSYQIVRENGSPACHMIYSREDSLIVHDGAHMRISIPKIGSDMPEYPIFSDLFKDSRGRYFLFPELKAPIPLVIRDYYGSTDTVSAREILNQAVMISACPDGLGFLVASGAGHDSEGGWNCFILKQDGSWDTDIPLIRGVKEMLEDGRIVFDSKKNKGVLDTNGVFRAMPGDYISPCRKHRSWYMIKDTASDKYGVYDVEHKRWQVVPKYSYLQDEIVPDVAIYIVVKKDTSANEKEWFGLMNIKEDREITPPLYDMIYPDGRVLKTTGKGQISFYIHPQTGMEYRDKQTF